MSPNNKRIGIHKVLANLKETGEFCVVTVKNTADYGKNKYMGERYVGNVSELGDKTVTLNPCMKLSGKVITKDYAINNLLGLPIGGSEKLEKTFLIDDIELPAYTGCINKE